jgi:hypothetical protein
MRRSLWDRIGGAAGRRAASTSAAPSSTALAIGARIAPDAGVDLAAGGFTRMWSAHLRSTPTELAEGGPPGYKRAPGACEREIVRAQAAFPRVAAAADAGTRTRSSVKWPRRYVETISFLQEGSDVDVLWRLNKMKFVLDYAAAFRTTANPDFARDACALVDSWCTANPYLIGVNWCSPLESGTRLVAWSMALAAFVDAPPPEEATCERIIRTMLRQADHLAGHFSQRDVPNNHLIGEAAMLSTFAAYWPILKDGPEWMRRAESVLETEAERQILKDGVQYENSINYHCYTLDFFLLYLHACAVRGGEPAAAVLRGVGAMAEALAAVVSPSGRLPMIGDDSWFFVLRGGRISFGPEGGSRSGT